MFTAGLTLSVFSSVDVNVHLINELNESFLYFDYHISYCFAVVLFFFWDRSRLSRGSLLRPCPS